LEAGIFFETSVINGQLTWCHTLEDVNINRITVRT